MDIVRNQEIVNEIGVKPLGIVLNMVHGKKYEMNNKEIEELTRLPVIAKIPFDMNVHKSLALKTPIVTYKPYTVASKEIIKLASNLIGETYKFDGTIQRFLNRMRLR
jgi:MinD-like ATPase involved in chromosome partitioning or flagellar assembly